MKQLTLENIAWYLPYELRGNYLLSDVVLIPPHKDEIRDKLLTSENVGFFVKYATPILLPMSDLTKTFIKDGEETTHLQELFKMALTHVYKYVPEYSIQLESYVFPTSGIIANYENNRYGFTFDFEPETDWIEFCLTHDGKSLKINQLALFQYLAKEKFDFQNLIADGLAIDSNTLQTNPYNNN